MNIDEILPKFTHFAENDVNQKNRPSRFKKMSESTIDVRLKRCYSSIEVNK
ncbi:hypothetical protein LLG10_07975 [bacterium]|nr:hypothetical protein [bacterium]